MDTGRSVAVMSRGFLAVSTAVLLGVVLLMTLMSSPAKAEVVQTDRLADGAVRTTYRMGPVEVTPGQNRIAFRPVPGASRPAEDGWITRIKPDLVNLDGSIPDSSKVMFHHGVWINQTGGQQELFYATGEEKTILAIPEGFGYRYRKNDVWILNDMIHNLTPQPMELYFEYTIDMIPATAPQAADTVRARPIWMDVENGIYPVFDVWRDSGGADGEFTFPEDASNPYPGGFEKNVKVVPQNGVLLNTTGHVHTGGLSTNLYLRREGVSWNGETCPERISFDDELIPLRERDVALAARVKRAKSKDSKLKVKLKKAKRNLKKAKAKAKKKAKRSLKKVQRQRKASAKSLSKARKAKASNAASLRQVEAKDRAERARDEACWSDKPRVDKGNRVQLFDSKAKYFDPRGPISWDMAMYSTDQDWRVRVKQGDLLELQTTYETKIASWPESMGINVLYWSTDGDINAVAGQPDPANAPDPYVTKVDQKGVLNHGHLSENEDYGGELPVVGPDARTLPDGLASGGPFTISDYLYNGADFRLPGAAGRPPVVQQGQSFTFKLSNYDIQNEVWHSLTSCKAPCNRSTGISYPIPDGEFQFESGQMGPGLEPTVGYTEWSTPADLPKGTHTFFCRIHPLMRGAVRVK